MRRRVARTRGSLGQERRGGRVLVEDGSAYHQGLERRVKRGDELTERGLSLGEDEKDGGERGRSEKGRAKVGGVGGETIHHASDGGWKRRERENAGEKRGEMEDRKRELWRDAEEKGLMKRGSGRMRRCIDDAREHSPGRCTLKVH